MPNFKPYNYNQSTMIVVNFKDQLQPGTFEYALHHLVDNKLDLSAFYPNYQNEDGGRPAYDPALLLKIILFAYSKGITSSREIQWCCDNNILFKALSCDSVPHYTTIAAFISDRTNEIEALFEQILLICDEQGLLGKELFAIDGCKMPSDASKEWSGTLKELEQKRDKIKRQIRHHIREHKRLDKSESREEERVNRKIDGYIPDNQFRSRDPKFTEQKTKYGKRNQHIKKTKTNVLPASEFQFDPIAKTCACPAGETLWLKHEGKDQNKNEKLYFEGRMSKYRYCKLKQQCMRNPESANHRKGNGRQVSFIINKSGKTPSYTNWMKQRVDSEKGKEIYSHRMSVVEPVFANIGSNKRLNRFSLRSQKKVQGQWQLYCIVHNIEKLANYGSIAA